MVVLVFRVMLFAFFALVIIGSVYALVQRVYRHARMRDMVRAAEEDLNEILRMAKKVQDIDAQKMEAARERIQKVLDEASRRYGGRKNADTKV